jgi:hypothetical protein
LDWRCVFGCTNIATAFVICRRMHCNRHYCCPRATEACATGGGDAINTLSGSKGEALAVGCWGLRETPSEE